jgi:hypothetical protein
MAVLRTEPGEQQDLAAGAEEQAADWIERNPTQVDP